MIWAGTTRKGLSRHNSAEPGGDKTASGMADAPKLHRSAADLTGGQPARDLP
jgi:hypothetical protein